MNAFVDGLMIDQMMDKKCGYSIGKIGNAVQLVSLL